MDIITGGLIERSLLPYLKCHDFHREMSFDMVAVETDLAVRAVLFERGLNRKITK